MGEAKRRGSYEIRRYAAIKKSSNRKREDKNYLSRKSAAPITNKSTLAALFLAFGTGIAYRNTKEFL